MSINSETFSNNTNGFAPDLVSNTKADIEGCGCIENVTARVVGVWKVDHDFTRAADAS